MSDDGESASTTSTLTTQILDRDEARVVDSASETVIPDDRLFGDAKAYERLGPAVRDGAGWGLLLLLFAVQVVDEFDRVAMGVLAPDIQESLGVSDAVLGAVGGAAGVLFVLGAIPLGMAADRFRRVKVGGLATVSWSIVVFLTGFVTNAFSLFVSRVGAGLGQSNALPVQNALAVDAYPLEARGRVLGFLASASPVGRATGPLLVGAIASIAGGSDGWRWAFWLISIPSLVLGLVFLFLTPEPERGRFDRQAHAAGLGDDVASAPVTFMGSFERLTAIETFHTILIGIGALGFGLFSVPLFVNLMLEERFGLEAFDRGLVAAGAQIPALIVLPVVAKRFDGLFRASPPDAVRLMATLIGCFGLLITAAVWMPNQYLFTLVFGLANVASVSGFALLAPLMSAVIPFRLRSQGFAILGIYIFLGGGFFGAVITGWMADAWGEQTALSLMALPSALLGAILLSRGRNSIRKDMLLVVEEFDEELAEQERRRSGEDVPVLQVRNLDFSYGPVQVLFDVDLDVHEGETLALLGTNGAGKSTLLRCLSGLGIPSRGVIRLRGSTITFADAGHRVRQGIVQLPGGKAVFRELTVRENLRLGSFSTRTDSAKVKARTDHVLGLFPMLRDRLDEPAGDLSGGQQQILALAKALLLEPDVLLIDELSLGLSPVATQELLGIIERLKTEGQTIVLVEQSVNIALSVADRAVFLERGAVRFEGPAHELLERDDLLRAVFLGTEGG